MTEQPTRKTNGYNGMAIDTRNKRSSTFQSGLEFLWTYPLPDGTIGTADRQHGARWYVGITAAAAQDIGIRRDTLQPNLEHASLLPDLTHGSAQPDQTHATKIIGTIV